MEHTQKPVRIGTRGSDLALYQAKYVQRALEKIRIPSEIIIIKTQGDVQDLSFDKMEGKGFFTKEIEDALINNQIDLAVHSQKDLSTQHHPELMIAAVSSRQNPSDVLIVRRDAVEMTSSYSLKQGAKVGTSSARRKTQFKAMRPDCDMVDIRGNVPTRIDKLRQGQFDAIIIAMAGIERLQIDLSEFHTYEFKPSEMVPAPAQGVIALQIKKSNADLKRVLQKINHRNTNKNINIERSILNRFDGGCQLPLGVYCAFKDGQYNVTASYARDTNSFPKRVFVKGNDPKHLVLKTQKQLMHNQGFRVFISRELEDDSYFRRALEAHGYSVEARSLIQTQPITFDSTLVDAKWVFFSSKNAVEYFFDANPVFFEDVKYGTIGEGTAEIIRKIGHHVSFVGKSNNTKMIADEFLELLDEGDKVIFPQAKNSLRSIQKVVERYYPIQDLEVYETLQSGLGTLEDYDIMVFTSPSNVESYFSQRPDYHRPEHFVAIGNSTAKALKDAGVQRFKIAQAFEETSLSEAVFSIY
jgi:hydroxymethylbilane synthase